MRLLSKISLVFVYLIILAGATVRMTGSGMGCPDWPKCFGYYIPPTNEKDLIFKSNHEYKKGIMILVDNKKFMVAKQNFKSKRNYSPNDWQLFTNHDYVVYNPVHTWIEYINRLVTIIAGIPIILMFIFSFKYQKKKPSVLLFATLTLIGMLFQAWLGKTVVDSNLAPYKITIHMLMALLIVFFILAIVEKTQNTIKVQIYNSTFHKILIFSIILSILQITLGTQVRQFVDEQIKLIGNERELWLSAPRINFYIHRSLSILVFIVNVYLWYINRKLKLKYAKVNFVMLCIFIEILTGIMMYYFEFPILTQPLHLLLASILFGVQIYLLMESRSQKIKMNKTVYNDL